MKKVLVTLALKHIKELIIIGHYEEVVKDIDKLIKEIEDEN